MLVESSSDEDAEFVVLPFILCKYAGGPGVLAHVPAVAGHHVVEHVLVEFRTDSKVCGHEEALVEAIVILCPGNPCEVGGLSVCIGIFACSVVTFPVDVLRGGEGTYLVPSVRGEIVEFESSCIDAVLYLLGDVGLVRGQIQAVASASLLAQVVVFANGSPESGH